MGQHWDSPVNSELTVRGAQATPRVRTKFASLTADDGRESLSQEPSVRVGTQRELYLSYSTRVLSSARNPAQYKHRVKNRSPQKSLNRSR